MALKLPQHEKLAKHKVQADTISAFLDWLELNGLEICDDDSGDYFPHHRTKSDIIGAFLEIDPVALEEEKRLMLRQLRKYTPPATQVSSPRRKAKQKKG